MVRVRCRDPVEGGATRPILRCRCGDPVGDGPTRPFVRCAARCAADPMLRSCGGVAVRTAVVGTAVVSVLPWLPWCVLRCGGECGPGAPLLGPEGLFPPAWDLKRRDHVMFAPSFATGRTPHRGDPFARPARSRAEQNRPGHPAPNGTTLGATAPNGAVRRAPHGTEPRAAPPPPGSVTPQRRSRCRGRASSARGARASRSGGCAHGSGRAPCRPRSGCARGRRRCRSAS